MNYILKRFSSNPQDTLGMLLGETFLAFTIEDEYRFPKVSGETRIPSGTYELGLRPSPKFSPKYGHDMIWIKDVPNFTNILIHAGNSEKDTEGCILVANCLDFNPTGASYLSKSRLAYDRIYPIISASIRSGILCKLQVIDTP